jgi:hypothetical protein
MFDALLQRTTPAMSTTCLDHILATATPFDDVFDSEALRHDVRVEPLPIWTNCGRRLDLQARALGWQVLSLRAVIDDAQATWTGWDDGAWDNGLEQL